MEKNYLNLNKDEQIGLNSMMKRIKNKELVVVPTDKSGRFAVLKHDQYIASGNKHSLCKIMFVNFI